MYLESSILGDVVDNVSVIWKNVKITIYDFKNS